VAQADATDQPMQCSFLKVLDLRRRRMSPVVYRRTRFS